VRRVSVSAPPATRSAVDLRYSELASPRERDEEEMFETWETIFAIAEG
jgi:hypothetical protein